MSTSPTLLSLLLSLATSAGQVSLPSTSVMSRDLDAVRAAPNSHAIVFENGRVRVLRVLIPAGQTEPVHTHAWPSVMKVERSQPITYISYDVREGKLVETGRHEQPARQSADAEWMEPEGPHAVANRGTGPYEAIRIELKPAG